MGSKNMERVYNDNMRISLSYKPPPSSRSIWYQLLEKADGLYPIDKENHPRPLEFGSTCSRCKKPQPLIAKCDTCRKERYFACFSDQCCYLQCIKIKGSDNFSAWSCKLCRMDLSCDWTLFYYRVGRKMNLMKLDSDEESSLEDDDQRGHLNEEMSAESDEEVEAEGNEPYWKKKLEARFKVYLNKIAILQRDFKLAETNRRKSMRSIEYVAQALRKRQSECSKCKRDYHERYRPCFMCDDQVIFNYCDPKECWGVLNGDRLVNVDWFCDKCRIKYSIFKYSIENYCCVCRNAMPVFTECSLCHLESWHHCSDSPPFCGSIYYPETSNTRRFNLCLCCLKTLWFLGELRMEELN